MAIVDINGNPIKSADWKEPQTSKVAYLYQRFAGHPSRGLTPSKLAGILEAAEMGDIAAQHDLFVDMEEKDGHILAEMGKRKRALLTVDWDVIPPRGASATEKKLASYAKELIQDTPNFENVILDGLDAIGHGFSCQEIEWQMLGTEWLPKQITHRPQSWFQTDHETRTQIRLRDMSYDGQALNPFGWITHVHRAKSGYISRCGLHRTLAWPYLFKNYSVGDLAEFLEIYGLPLRLGTYQSGASDDEKATLLRAVMSIGHDAAGIIPEGMAIDFKEAAKGDSKPFETMITWCELTVSKAVLGGTLTSQADGKSSTNALGKVHNEVRHDLMMADAIQLGGTLTRDLVYPLLTLNKGGISDRRRMPRFIFHVEDLVDVAQMAEALPLLTGIGMKIPAAWAHQQMGIPQPDEGEEVLGAPAAPPPPADPAKGIAAAFAALTAGGGTQNAQWLAEQQALADNLAAAAGPAWDKVLTHIQALVKSAASVEALQTSLVDAYGGLPLDDLRAIMDTGLAVAELAGIADVKAGS